MTVRCAFSSAFAGTALQRLGNNPYAFGKRTNRVHVHSIAQMFQEGNTITKSHFGNVPTLVPVLHSPC